MDFRASQGYRQRLDTVLIQLFDQLQRSIRRRSSSRSLTVCDEVIRYLQKHRSETFHSADMQAELHFHQDYLTRCLKKHTGLTPLQYLQMIRMEEAKHLLVGT